MIGFSMYIYLLIHTFILGYVCFINFMIKLLDWKTHTPECLRLFLGGKVILGEAHLIIIKGTR